VTGGIVITVHRVATHSNRPLETPSLKIARAEDNILHRRSNARYRLTDRSAIIGGTVNPQSCRT
jgi:hypothetical protein